MTGGRGKTSSLNVDNSANALVSRDEGGVSERGEDYYRSSAPMKGTSGRVGLVNDDIAMHPPDRVSGLESRARRGSVLDRTCGSVEPVDLATALFTFGVRFGCGRHAWLRQCWSTSL